MLAVTRSQSDLVYIYMLNLPQMGAGTIQSLSTVRELARHRSITMVSPWVSMYRLRLLQKRWRLPASVKIVRSPVPAKLRYVFSPDVERLLFTFTVLVYVGIRRRCVIFTRDISLPLLLSYIPGIFRPQRDLTLELHKTYFLASSKVKKRIEARAYGMADRFVCTTQATANDVEHLFGVPPRRIHVLRNAVDYRYVRACVARLSLPTGNRPSVAYSGSFKDWKGVDLLAQAWSMMDRPSGKLLLVGADENEIGTIVELCRNLRITDSVTIVPRKSHREALRLVASAQVAVLPNPHSPEGTRYTSPIKLFEYLAIGLPIVASRLPSFQEILTEGENCLFFCPGDASDLAAKLQRILNDTQGRKTMSEANVALAQANTWALRAESLERILPGHTMARRSG